MTQEQQLIEAYRQAAEIRRIATRAVRKAQDESRRLGVANVYSRNGRLYFDPQEPIDSGSSTSRGSTQVPDPAITANAKTPGDSIVPTVDEIDRESHQ